MEQGGGRHSGPSGENDAKHGLSSILSEGLLLQNPKETAKKKKKTS